MNTIDPKGINQELLKIREP